MRSNGTVKRGRVIAGGKTVGLDTQNVSLQRPLKNFWKNSPLDRNASFPLFSMFTLSLNK
jgi:hypothetical protein